MFKENTLVTRDELITHIKALDVVSLHGQVDTGNGGSESFTVGGNDESKLHERLDECKSGYSFCLTYRAGFDTFNQLIFVQSEQGGYQVLSDALAYTL